MPVGKFLRGAVIQLKDNFPLAIPNVIVFQFNPETMTHNWTPTRSSAGGASGQVADPRAVAGTPEETFSFTLVMDAADMITDGGPVEGGIAAVSGVYTRLAALEMLLFPEAAEAGGLLGSVSASLSAGGLSLGGSASSAPTQTVPQQLPAAIFVWGPGRIVPIVVTSLSITEKLYDAALLNPIHAEAHIAMRVVRHEELSYVHGTLGTVARGASSYTQTLREALAIANLGNAVSDIIGMLPI
jgi:hypothetical protein